jgi:hypothetical protein
MSFIGQLLGGGDFVTAVGNVVDKFVTTDKERLELQVEREKAAQDHEYRMEQLDQQLDIAQTEVNKAEAASGSLFVAGWRPAIGWVCAVALAYQFIGYPLLIWFAIDRHPPQMDMADLYPLIFGMLGIAGMRSFDKLKGVHTNKVGK